MAIPHFTIDFINAENERLYSAFRKKHKDPRARWSQKAEMFHISETIRGLYVMEKWQREGGNGSPLAMLKFYSLAEDVMPSFVKTYLSGIAGANKGVDKPEKRKHKWSAFEKWADEHRGEQYTTDQLVEVSGFSYQTTLKYISDSHLFIKVKKGLWQVADPKDDSE